MILLAVALKDTNASSVPILLLCLLWGFLPIIIYTWKAQSYCDNFHHHYDWAFHIYIIIDKNPHGKQRRIWTELDKYSEETWKRSGKIKKQSEREGWRWIGEKLILLIFVISSVVISLVS